MSGDEVLPAPEEDASKTPRTSVRVLNKQLLQTKSSSSSILTGGDIPLEEPSNNGGSTSNENSKKRTWEQWWSEDERSFYEALSDCGKNFDSIREYFVRQKKTNKTKDQIRTFYYRTWHKISRYINFPEGLSKSTKELYGLINYGELRKRLVGGKLDEKNAAKLSELVFNGSTTLRIKGKTVRLKTPMCPALKRLNNRRLSSSSSSTFVSPLNKELTDSESTEASRRLPRSININLTPLNHDDFIRVHSKSFQNPKLSLGTDLQRTVGSLVKYLEAKWTSRMTEPIKRKEQLTLLPKPGVILKKPIFLPVEPLTSEDLSLGKVTKEDNNKEEEEESEPMSEEKESDDKILASPWNADCTLTVGEMYLMLGHGDEVEIELNYSFKVTDEPEESFEKDIRYKTLNTLIKLVHDKLKKSKSSPLRNDEEQFRRPAAPTPAATAFKQQLDLLLPKYNNRKGRPMSRKSSASRLNGGPQRALQPKFYLPSSSKSEVKLRLLPQVTVTHPLISIQEPLSLQIPTTYQVLTTTATETPSVETPLESNSHRQTMDGGLNSPTESFSSLKSTDRFLDSVLENSNCSLLQTPIRSRPTSPFYIDGNNSSPSWSFPSSPFPADRSSRIIINEEDSSHSTNSEVDRQLLSMMTESSVDFTSKFAKLASHITSDV